MKYYRMMVALLVLMVASVGLVYADDVGSPVREELSRILIETVAPLMAALLSTMGVMVLRWVNVRFKLQSLQELENLATSAAQRGVAAAAEYSASKIKHSKIKISGSQKFNLAVAEVMQSVPKLKREQAAAYVKAAVAQYYGEGATGSTVGWQGPPASPAAAASPGVAQ